MKKEIRMLAAIMFTDMVGYTVMMQEDEMKAKALRDRHRKVLQNLILEHSGQILQYYGDGTLVVQLKQQFVAPESSKSYNAIQKYH
jgi:class 3 adenylate cyclase